MKNSWILWICICIGCAEASHATQAEFRQCILPKLPSFRKTFFSLATIGVGSAIMCRVINSQVYQEAMEGRALAGLGSAVGLWGLLACSIAKYYQKFTYLHCLRLAGSSLLFGQWSDEDFSSRDGQPYASQASGDAAAALGSPEASIQHDTSSLLPGAPFSAVTAPPVVASRNFFPWEGPIYALDIETIFPVVIRQDDLNQAGSCWFEGDEKTRCIQEIRVCRDQNKIIFTPVRKLGAILLSRTTVTVNGVLVASTPINRCVIALPNLSHLQEITYRGFGNLEVNGKIAGDQFTLNTYGHGNVAIDEVAVKKLHIGFCSVGNIAIAGHASYAQIDLKGIGTCNVSQLQVDQWGQADPPCQACWLLRSR